MDDDRSNFDDQDDMERQKYQEAVENILSKIGKGGNPVNCEDIMQYLRVINHNFTSLSRLIQAIFYKQDLIESSLVELHTKLDEILDTDEIIEDSLNATDDREE